MSHKEIHELLSWSIGENDLGHGVIVCNLPDPFGAFEPRGRLVATFTRKRSGSWKWRISSPIVSAEAGRWGEAPSREQALGDIAQALEAFRDQIHEQITEVLMDQYREWKKAGAPPPERVLARLYLEKEILSWRRVE